jgi:translation initiation factor 2B subunit (eIF-2B alpha/beta/delta family)
MYARYMDSKDEDIRELGNQIRDLQEVVRASERQVVALRATVSDLVSTVRTQEKEVSALKQEQQAAAQAIQEMMEVIKKAVG